jgi:hypothetical protein
MISVLNGSLREWTVPDVTENSRMQSPSEQRKRRRRMLYGSVLPHFGQNGWPPLADHRKMQKRP